MTYDEKQRDTEERHEREVGAETQSLQEETGGETGRETQIPERKEETEKEET